VSAGLLVLLCCLQESLVKFYISQGADPAKLNLGLITYGRSFTLKNATDNGIGAAASGPGTMGVVIPEAGVLAYADVCLNKWPETWDSVQMVPYASKGDQWVGYDNPKSVAAKVGTTRRTAVLKRTSWL